MNKLFIVAALSLGLNVGNAMALTAEDIKKVKNEYVPVAKPIIRGIFKAGMSEESADQILTYLLLGVDLADFSLSFKDNVNGVKNSLGLAKTAFLDALGGTKSDGTVVKGTLNEIKDKLKNPATPANEKEKLAVQLNTQIITLIDKFNDFINKAANDLFIPLMSYLEAMPGVKDVMKFKSGASFSQYTKDNINSLADVLKIEKNLTTKLEAIVNQAAQVENAVATGAPLPAPAAPISFDDL